jgi:hypothetical protein
VKRKPKVWKERVGRHGSSVTVYESKPGGVLWVRWYENGRRRKRSLGHTDPDLAVKQAAEIVARDDRDGHPDRPVTMRELYTLYKQEVTPGQRADVQTLQLRHGRCCLNYFGPEFDVRGLDVRDWNALSRDRASGAVDARGQRVLADKRRPVGEGAVAGTLVWLRAACRLATTVRVAPGRFLLEVDPTRGLKVPENPNPAQELYSDEEYEALLAVACQVHPALPPLLVLSHDGGRRLDANRSVRWSDWLPEPVEGAPYGRLRWRKDSDKLGREWVTPVTHGVRASLEAHRQRFPGVGETWVFPHLQDQTKPLSKDTARRWLLEAEDLANVEHRPRRGWHGLRRSWATKRKGQSLQDVMYLGGWVDSKALTKLYQKPDLDSLLGVLEAERPLRKAGGGR